MLFLENSFPIFREEFYEIVQTINPAKGGSTCLFSNEKQFMRRFSYLLPRGFRRLGFIFIVAGVILGIIRFYFGIKPALLEGKVFAIYSVFLHSKSMVVIKNQLIEEIVGLLLIIGLFIVAFAREKNEGPEISATRLNAFILSVYLNTFFVIAAILFTYGIAFIYMMIISLFLQLSFYIFSFRIMIYIERNKGK